MRKFINYLKTRLLEYLLIDLCNGTGCTNCESNISNNSNKCSCALTYIFEHARNKWGDFSQWR